MLSAIWPLQFFPKSPSWPFGPGNRPPRARLSQLRWHRHLQARQAPSGRLLDLSLGQSDIHDSVGAYCSDWHRLDGMPRNRLNNGLLEAGRCRPCKGAKRRWAKECAAMSRPDARLKCSSRSRICIFSFMKLTILTHRYHMTEHLSSRVSIVELRLEPDLAVLVDRF